MFNPSERIALAAQDRAASQAEWLRLVASLRDEAGFWWLDSAMVDGRLGRLSFAGTDPYLWLRSRGPIVEIDVQRDIRPGLSIGNQRSRTNPIEMARTLLPRADSVLYSTLSGDRTRNREWHEVAGLSDGLDLPFLGGAVGYFGYELAAQIEPRIRFGNPNDLDLAELSLAFVDQVFAYDHRAQRLWLLGLGFGGSGEGPRDSLGPDAREQALVRSRSLVDRLEARVDAVLREPERAPPARPADGSRVRMGGKATRGGSADIESTMDASSYAKAVDSILEEIEKGNLYQANFSQRLSAPAPFDSWRLYTNLRRENPAPFCAYLTQPGGVAILSSSPERFLELDLSRRVESRPIKGTRPRGENELEDVRLEEELATSEKDQAENLMIVDLVRNDLGRVCTPGTIEVPELMEIEAYAAVFQMVSTVTGALAPGKDAFDLIDATFPPGSMTGAPKLASIDLLERLESVRRGVYAGALGYLDLRGGLDLSVVIRTFVCKDGVAYLHVGGGVVADSSPEGEYLESLDKARAPLAALEAAAASSEGARDA
jgi:para-aminobenzoate synthetase component 1